MTWQCLEYCLMLSAHRCTSHSPCHTYVVFILQGHMAWWRWGRQGAPICFAKINTRWERVSLALHFLQQVLVSLFPKEIKWLARTFQLAFRWGKSIFPADLGQKHATRYATGTIQLNVRHVWQQRASLSSASERLSFFSLSLGSLSWGTWTYIGEDLRFPALFEKPGQQIGKLDLCKQE